MLQRLVVLEPERILTYVRRCRAAGVAGSAAANWIEDQHSRLPHTRPFPRDVRGELVAAQDHLFDAYLPGCECSGTTTGRTDCGDVRGQRRSVAGRRRRSGRSTTRCAILSRACWRRDSGWRLRRSTRRQTFRVPTGTGMLLNAVDGRVMLIENKHAEDGERRGRLGKRFCGDPLGVRVGRAGAGVRYGRGGGGGQSARV